MGKIQLLTENNIDMNLMPTISIIVPVYKAENYIQTCVESILKQTYEDFELLLVDDGTPDFSGIICDKLAQTDVRIKVFHKENGGVSSARNYGISHAKGKWICFIDSDDYIDETYLENFMIAEESSDFILQGYKKIYHERILSQVNFEGFESHDFDKILAFSENNHIINSPCFKLYKLSVIKENELQFDSNISYGEDHLFSLSYVICINRITYSRGDGYNYLITDSESLTRRVVPYSQMIYYIEKAKEKSALILSKCHSVILEEAFCTTYIDNVFRAYRYFFASDNTLNDYKAFIARMNVNNLNIKGIYWKRKIAFIIQKYLPSHFSYRLFRIFKDLSLL